MKLFSKIVSYLLFSAGVLMTFLPISWFPAFYDVRYSGWSMIGTALIIYFLPLFLKAPADAPDVAKKNRAIDLFQLFITIVILADAFGALGLYELYRYGIPYSYILHVAEPFFGVIILTKVINLRFDIKISRAVIIALIIVLTWGIVWEIFENLSDLLLHTHLAGRAPSSTKNTTAVNLIQDTIGAGCGLIYILLKNYFSKKTR